VRVVPVAVSGVNVFTIREIKKQGIQRGGREKEIDTLKGHSVFLKPTLLSTQHVRFIVRPFVKAKPYLGRGLGEDRIPAKSL